MGSFQMNMWNKSSRTGKRSVWHVWLSIAAYLKNAQKQKTFYLIFNTFHIFSSRLDPVGTQTEASAPNLSKPFLRTCETNLNLNFLWILPSVRFASACVFCFKSPPTSLSYLACVSLAGTDLQPTTWRSGQISRQHSKKLHHQLASLYKVSLQKAP